MSALFPELDGLAPEPGAALDAPLEAPRASAATGPHEGLAFDGGYATIARFEVLFAAPGRVLRVGRTATGEIDIVFDLGAAGTCKVGLMPRGGDAWKEAAHFGVRYEGEGGLHPALERLLRHFVFRHAETRLEAFLAVVVPQELDTLALSWDDASSLVYSYGSVKGWRTFFESRELYRGVCAHMAGDVVQVTHSELECDASLVKRSAATPSFLRSLNVEPRATGAAGHYLVTDLQDLDVIKGGDARLDAALDSIASFTERPALVLVGSTCVPIVTGDDIEASADRARRKHQLPIVTIGNNHNPEAVYLARLLDTPEARAVPRRKGTVNLIGMSRVVGYDATIALLLACGIEINCAVLPDLDPQQVLSFGAAELHVLYPWARQTSAASALLARFDAPTITPPAPFGRAGTRAWLLAIAGALGKRVEAERVWDERATATEPTWRDLQAAASQYRLGFVIPDEAWTATLGSEERLGAPLLELVEEMGFGVDILLYSGKARIPALPGGGAARRRFVPYQSASELEARLRASDAVAFYSELYFDPRLTRTGKNAFSIHDFQLGLDGALATLRRLLAICRLPYFRTYSRYLGSPFAPSHSGPRPPSRSEEKR